MRILHTSDWHLGKYMGEYSRHKEQEEFIDELVELADAREVDLILVAGDVYDTVITSAAAERLFFDAMKRLSKSATRPIIIIAGNHDGPARLTASSNLITEMGIIIFGMPGDIIPEGEFEHFSIKNSGAGFIELEVSGESAIILAMPYPSERRLGTVLGDIDNEQDHRLSYSERIGEIFGELSENYRPDTVNLAIGHFYLKGGEASGSERDISLGGGYAVSPDAMPSKAQYIALGHLHRAQKTSAKNAYYSGSPIAYDISESVYAKCVYIADITPGADSAEVEKIYLRCYKPFVMIEAESVDEAVEKITVEAGKSWLTVKINLKRFLTASEIRRIRSTGGEILEILSGAEIITDSGADNRQFTYDSFIDPKSEFVKFYAERRGTMPSEDTIELFVDLINMQEGDDC